MMEGELDVSVVLPVYNERGHLRQEIDQLDADILAAVQRRTEVSRLIGKARMASGGTRLVCASGDGAAKMKRKLKSDLIAGDPPRQGHRPFSPLW